MNEAFPGAHAQIRGWCLLVHEHLQRYHVSRNCSHLKGVRVPAHMGPHSCILQSEWLSFCCDGYVLSSNSPAMRLHTLIWLLPFNYLLLWAAYLHTFPFYKYFLLICNSLYIWNSVFYFLIRCFIKILLVCALNFFLTEVQKWNVGAYFHILPSLMI